MLDSDDIATPSTPPADSSGDADRAPAAPRKRAPRKVAAKKAVAAAGESGPAGEPADDAPAPRKRAPRKKAADTAPADAQEAAPASAGEPAGEPVKKAAKKAAKKAPAKKAAKRPAATDDPTQQAVTAAAVVEAPTADAPAPGAARDGAAEPEAPTAREEQAAPAKRAPRKRAASKTAEPAPAAEASAESEPPATPALAAPGVLFQPPAAEPAPRRRRAVKKTAAAEQPAAELTEAPPVEPAPGEADITAAEELEDETAEPEDVREIAAEQATGARRRRRRGRRGRGGAKPADEGETVEGDEAAVGDGDTAEDTDDSAEDTAEDTAEGGTRRRRRRRRSGAADDDSAPDDPANTVTHVREPARERQSGDDGVKGVKGSTRLEAKRQRRRDGRETTRRRAPILTEAEFLARREAVERVMAVRQNGDRTQIAVLEDDILVEHYVTRASATSYVGNVYLGRVQNVLPSMEAAFVDIGKGRNGVLYAGEVNWDAAGLEGKSRAIENALKAGDTVLVQVTKDPIGHKGARLTSQISLPGRFLVYVPGGGMTGISRRLPDTERHRLKAILKKIVPEDGGVIVRTAAEGASEEDLTRDVERLTAQWESIQQKAQNGKSAPSLIHGEPDLATRVVRDVFNEDFKALVVQGEQAWAQVSEYVQGVAPDLAERVTKHAKNSDLFADLRVDEQLMKALDRKVWLPSGGSLIIDRTEAMTVIDVNTGKFVGAGGNLEQTVTRNNLEAAEEIVRQLRLRDVGGIVVIDFIDMVLESNRELVLRRLIECLGRDRTKHQVAEVTSLGLVQMTRKRVGEGLLEAFSETCEHCKGRGVIVSTEPVERPGGSGNGSDDDRSGGRSRRKRGGRTGAAEVEPVPAANDEQRRAATAAIAAIHRAATGEKANGESGLDALASGLVAAALAEGSEADGASGSPGTSTDVSAEVETRKVTAVDDAGFGGETGSASVDARPDSGATASPDGAPVDETPADSVSQPAPRRRRRAASRPAGPPSVA